MKYKLRIQHNGNEYTTQADDFTPEQLENLKELVQMAIKGELGYINFTVDGNLIHFPKNILINSVITIVHVEL